MAFERPPRRSGVLPDPPSPQPTLVPTRHPLEGLGRVALAGEIELRNRAFCLTATQRWAAAAAIVLPLVLAAGIVLYTLASVAGGSNAESTEGLIEALRSGLWAELSKNVGQLVLFGVTTLVSAAGLARGMRERLFIGPEGIRYFTGLPGWIGPLGGGWSVAADQIRELRIGSTFLGSAPALAQLVIETTGKTRKLGVFIYVDPTHYAPSDFRVLTRMRPDEAEIAALFERMPLVAYARRAGYAVGLPEMAPPEASLEISFASKPRVATTVLVLFAAFGYAVIDMGMISETYAAGAPLWLIVPGGLAIGALAWPLLGSEELSRRGRIGMAGLVALATMGALYPGLIRINRIGAPPPERHTYRHSETQTLEPVESGSPALDLPDIVALLPGSEPGDVHELWIRRGSLGFDQLDIDALDAWIDELERGPS